MTNDGPYGTKSYVHNKRSKNYLSDDYKSLRISEHDHACITFREQSNLAQVYNQALHGLTQHPCW